MSVARRYLQVLSPALERLAAKLLGSVALCDFAARLREEDIAAFPILEMCEAEEHNVVLMESERRSAPWRAALERAARELGVDRERLEALCRQRFYLAHGRRLTQLRELLMLTGGGPVGLATDLPPALLAALRGEQRWHASRLQVAGGASALLRFATWCGDLWRLVELHGAAAVRICQLLALPRASGGRRPYAVWLGAEAAALADSGPHAYSLPEFLHEALQAGTVEEIVIQGAPPGRPLPAGLSHRSNRFALRCRPRAGALLLALARQLRLLALDIAASGDWRRRQLVAPVSAALPGLLLWFDADPPAAVLYANSAIGAESPASVLPRPRGPSTTMVFYSANVAYWARPAMVPGAPDLEPEIRCIVADRLGMWSPEMRDGFLAAGFGPERLPVTGIVHYGRQAGFRPASRLVPRQTGRVRLGVFDVSAVKPEFRFNAGWGQTLYHPAFRERFFRELIGAAQARWGEDLMIVRKLKRRLNSRVHEDDLDLEALLPASQFLSPAPDTSLWTVLSQVDLVVCMPFTSVAFMADHYGIPAAYFDPTGSSSHTSLAGRAPLLLGRAALDSWLADPKANTGYDPGLIVAGEALKAACGESWQEPRPPLGGVSTAGE